MAGAESRRCLPNQVDDFRLGPRSATFVPLGQRQADLVTIRSRSAVEAQAEERLKASDLTEEEQKEFEIVWRTEQMYADAKKAREPFETFDIAWDLFIGNVWPTRWPTWRARITVNKIRAFITFMQAIMTDNKPRFSVEPTYWGSEDAADLLHQLADRHWDDDDVQDKMSLVCLYGLIWGTGFIKRWFDPYADGGRGKHMSVAVPPYRIFANQTATCVEDAEYIIHVEDQTMGWVRRNFPDKAKLVSGVKGVRTGDFKERDRDFVREGDQNEQLRIVSAQNMGNGNITPPLYASPNQHAMPNDSDLVRKIRSVGSATTAAKSISARNTRTGNPSCSRSPRTTARMKWRRPAHARR